MAVSHAGSTESHTGAIGSISEASFTWTGPVGAPPHEGVLIFVFNLVSGANIVSSVTYGATSVPLVAGGEAIDSAGEPGWCGAYFIGSGFPTGSSQAVVVNRTNNTDELYATCTLLQALGDTEVYTAGIVLLQGDGTLAEQSVDDGSPGTDSERYAGTFSGLASVPGPGINTSALLSFDTGQQTAAVVREANTGQGSRLVGFASGTSDDRAAVHLAVREAAAAAERVPRFSPYPQILAH